MKWLTLVFLLAPLLFPPAVLAADTSKRAPAGNGDPGYVPDKGATVIEGFESGSMPPGGWSVVVFNPSETWFINDFNPHSGAYHASIFYDESTGQQEEIIYSSQLVPSSQLLVSFWSFGSLYWCRDDMNNCDLRVYLDGDNIWGNGNEQLVYTADEDWPDTWVYGQSNLDLSSYVDGSPLYVAFAYVGQDGAEVGLDDIEITTDEGGGGVDSYEPDNTPSTAQRLHPSPVTQNHSVHTDGDVDWFVICVENGSSASVETSNLSGTHPDTVIEIYDADCNMIAFDDNSGTGLESYVEWVAAYTGDYYIKARTYGGISGQCDEQGGGSAFCAYTISVNWTGCDDIQPCVEDDTGVLDIPQGALPPSGTVAIPVRIQGASDVVSALGFEVVFDPSVLTFNDYTRGSLVENWSFFDVTNPETGVVRVGGFTTGGAIPSGASGDVVYLNFDVVACERGSVYRLDLQQLKNDIQPWSTSHGCWECGCVCDVNGDGEITPGDALCAFQKYLGACPTTCGPCDEICCDVNMDGECTPADALEIFKDYMGLPSICSGPSSPCTAPPYNPEKWNDQGEVQYNNNCYNYANDEITGTFAQPGKWCGDMYASLTCSEVLNGAVCDGLVVSDKESACPDGMHKVYLVVWPGSDYHWYRQDLGGWWSHKPGSTAVRDYDSSGDEISDPDTADTGWYTARCGYLCACGDNATIR